MGQLGRETHLTQTPPWQLTVEAQTLREALTLQEDHRQGGEARGVGGCSKSSPTPIIPIALVCSAGPLSNIGSL